LDPNLSTIANWFLRFSDNRCNRNLANRQTNKQTYKSQKQATKNNTLPAIVINESTLYVKGKESEFI